MFLNFYFYVKIDLFSIALNAKKLCKNGITFETPSVFPSHDDMMLLV